MILAVIYWVLLIGWAAVCMWPNTAENVAAKVYGARERALLFVLLAISGWQLFIAPIAPHIFR